jgi:hypothetical protein
MERKQLLVLVRECEVLEIAETGQLREMGKKKPRKLSADQSSIAVYSSKYFNEKS